MTNTKGTGSGKTVTRPQISTHPFLYLTALVANFVLNKVRLKILKLVLQNNVNWQ